MWNANGHECRRAVCPAAPRAVHSGLTQFLPLAWTVFSVAFVVLIGPVAALSACAFSDHSACVVPHFSISALLCIDPSATSTPSGCSPFIQGFEICQMAPWVSAYTCYFSRGCDPTIYTGGRNCTTIFSSLCSPTFTTWECNLSPCYRAGLGAGCNVSLIPTPAPPTTAAPPTIAPEPAPSCVLPCLPCGANGVCNTSARYYDATEEHWYGSCECSAGYTGTQCQINMNTTCASGCLHNGTCRYGTCICEPPFSGSNCDTPECLHQVSGSSATTPVNASGQCDLPCQDGYGDMFCRAPVSQSGCDDFHPSSTYTNSLWSSERTTNISCLSNSPGWNALVGGSSYFYWECNKPSGWNDSFVADGTCRGESWRYSTDLHILEETFYCDFSECSARAYLPYADSSASYFSIGQTSPEYHEPANAMALRSLLLAVAVLCGGCALFPFPGKASVMIALLTATVFFIALNLTVGAAENVAFNLPNKSITEFTSATDTNVLVTCQKTECYCNYDVRGSPNCRSQMGDVINQLKRQAKLTCNNVTKTCAFQHQDLFAGSFTVFMNCEARDCVTSYPEVVTTAEAAASAQDNTAAVVVGTVGCMFVFWVVVSLVLHAKAVAEGGRLWAERHASSGGCLGADRKRVAGGSPSGETDLAHRPSATREAPAPAALPELWSATAATEAAADINNPLHTLNSGVGAAAAAAANTLERHSTVADACSSAEAYAYQSGGTMRSPVINGTTKSGASSTALKLQVDHVTYVVHPSAWEGVLHRAADRVIVKDFTATFTSGRMYAIMGPSGCGKTSLLDTLCKRQKTGCVSGSVSLGHASASRRNLVVIDRSNDTIYRQIVGYAADDDVILPTLTVVKALEFAAELRQPEFIPREEKLAFIHRLLDTFRLTACRDTVVGMPHTTGDSRGFLSQGERRRLSITLHLVSLPRVLILDEPTTGLDSYNARLVVTCLKRVSQISQDSLYAGYYPSFFNYSPLILMTIHQPTSDMFAEFDEVCVMSSGRNFYMGPPHSALQAIEPLLQKMGGAMGGGKVEGVASPPSSFPEALPSNLASSSPFVSMAAPDVLLELASIIPPEDLDGFLDFETRNEAPEQDDEQHNVADAQTSPRPRVESRGGSVTVDHAAAVAPPPTSTSDPSPPPAPRSVPPGVDLIAAFQQEKELFYPRFWTQVNILVRRGWYHVVHDGRVLALHFLVSTIITFIASFLYQNSGMDVPGTLSKAGAVTFYLLWLAIINLSALDLYLSERGTYIFETSSGAYSTAAYFAAKVVLDSLLLRVIPTCIGGLLMYFQIGLRVDTDPLGYFILITILFSLVCSGFCATVACIVPNFGVGILFNGFLIIFLFAFGGFMSQTNIMPVGLRWIRYVSPFYYGFESILVNQLAGQTCFFQTLDPSGAATSPALPIACEQYLYNLGLDPAHFNFDVAMLGAWAAISLLSSFLSLRFLVDGKR